MNTEARGPAISFTFDDGSQSHFDIAFPLLQEFGFKGTFFVIPGLTRERKSDPPLPGRARSWWAEVSWEEWRVVASAGHEIGNHSLTHPIGGLTKIADDARLESEIADSARQIAEKIGHPPASFAYPFNRSDERVRNIVRRHHRAARESRTRYGGWRFSLASANRLVDRAIRRREWIVAMIHGIDSGFDVIPADLLREHLRYVNERRAEVRVDTFANLSR